MYTVSDLISIIRNKLQESNTTKVSDAEILYALNQGQDFAFDIIARRYPDSIAVSQAATLNSDNTITIPEGAFEQRLTRVYRNNADNYTTPLERVDYREKDDFLGRQGVPTSYAILKNKVYLLPATNISSYTYNIAYVDDVEPFVKDQGRITSINLDGSAAAILVDAGGNASIVVDSLGSGLTADVSSINRFVNLVDGQTGLIKCSLEVKTIDTATNTVVFKSTVTRSSVLNRTIAADVTTDVEADDYICLIEGSCVPYFKKPSSNFILQFATVEIKRSLGMDAQQEEVALRKYEEQMEKINSKRESTERVFRRRYSRSSNRRW
jgi:hypothetical protein